MWKVTGMIDVLVLVLRPFISKYCGNQYHIAVTERIDWNGMIVLKELIWSCNETTNDCELNDRKSASW